jgi:ferredoxin
MSEARFLSSANVGRLVSALNASGSRVVGPSRHNGRLEFRRITKAEELDLGGGLPALPLKALFLPPTEVLFTWRQQQSDVTLSPVPTTFQSTVVLAARPCDAAAVETLDKVMGWDYRDELWFGRREATTIVTLACSSFDSDCFCDAVGLSPDATKGSDLLLREAPGGYEATLVTPKGARLVQQNGDLFEAGRPTQAVPTPQRQVPVDLSGVDAWLQAHFEDPIWAGIGAKCHGCSACASVCPTCHCFDIVDEPDGLRGGSRRRNWDACQASKFTVHASGHNPRGDQNARFRQRVLHKFQIYPQRFGDILCTGCGRCARVCAAGQHIVEIVGEIGRAAAAARTAETRP